MELATDVIFLSLSSVNNDLFIYVFVTSWGGEIGYVVTVELKNISCISARVTCTIIFSVKETWVLRLIICCSVSCKGANMLLKMIASMIKKRQALKQ